uniref:Uncharacterized protein n=1 Tax=Plectus sambesii TaxID=2011161 RepID=A0A914WL39_9BILA
MIDSTYKVSHHRPRHICVASCFLRRAQHHLALSLVPLVVDHTLACVKQRSVRIPFDRCLSPKANSNELDRLRRRWDDDIRPDRCAIGRHRESDVDRGPVRHEIHKLGGRLAASSSSPAPRHFPTRRCSSAFNTRCVATDAADRKMASAQSGPTHISRPRRSVTTLAPNPRRLSRSLQNLELLMEYECLGLLLQSPKKMQKSVAYTSTELEMPQTVKTTGKPVIVMAPLEIRSCHGRLSETKSALGSFRNDDEKDENRHPNTEMLLKKIDSLELPDKK